MTGVKAGTATITVTTEDGGKTATCQVTVKANTVVVTGVTLNKSTLSLNVGASETLTATIAPANASNKNVTWKSSDAAVGKTATCQVTVKANTVAVTGVTLNKSTLTLKVGASETLTATIAPADATNKNVTWASSDAAVATVDASGKVTGVAAGTATITVTTEDGGKTATCQVTVKANTVPVTGVTLNKIVLKLYTGGSETLKATVAPANATNKYVTWTSSNPAVATVDANGKVTAKSLGMADITVTTKDGGYTATCRVGVVRRPGGDVSVTGVTLNKTTLKLGKGTSETLTATVAPTNATNKKVTWTSSDPAVATVDASGKVTGVANQERQSRSLYYRNSYLVMPYENNTYIYNGRRGTDTGRLRQRRIH